MSDAGLIYKKLPQVAAAVGWVGKTGQNRQQGYNFRGIDAVLKHVSPALREHGVTVVPSVISDTVKDEEIVSKQGGHGYRVTMLIEYRFYAEDGSFVSATLRGEGADYADKASNKAMSQAFKYVLVQVLNLPTDEPDADEDSPEVSRPAARQQRKTPAKAPAKKPAADSPTDSAGSGWQIYTRHTRNDDGTWPMVCPNCTSQVAQKEVTYQKDGKQITSKIWQCTNDQCGGGRAKRGGGFFPWSSFGHRDEIWGDDGLIEQEAPDSPTPVKWEPGEEPFD